MHTDDKWVYFSTTDNEAIQFNPKLEEDEFAYAHRPLQWNTLRTDATSAGANRFYDGYCRDYPNGVLQFRRPLHLWAEKPDPNPHFL